MVLDLAALPLMALKLAVALLLGSAIGFERQWNQKMAGLRTNALMALGACGMSMAMPNISAMISRASPPDRQGAMLGLNMASSSVARIFGPMIAGALFSGLGHDWPFLVGALLTIPAAIMAINAGRAIRRGQVAADAPAKSLT